MSSPNLVYKSAVIRKIFSNPTVGLDRPADLKNSVRVVHNRKHNETRGTCISFLNFGATLDILEVK